MATAGFGPFFSFLGNLSLADRCPRAGVIGSRQSHRDSLTALEAACHNLVNRGALIVSGAARGADMAAHQAALAAGGCTIACIPSGIDYYLRNAPRLDPAAVGDDSLYLILSPFSPAEPASRQTPVLRNRLIAALSEALVVGETGLVSGTNHCLQAAMGFGIPCYFLSDPPETTPALQMAFRDLERRGGIPYRQDEALSPELAASIINSAETFARQRNAARRAQLQLFDDLS